MGRSKKPKYNEEADYNDTNAEMLRRAREEILYFANYVNPEYRTGWHHRFLAKKLDQFVAGNIRFLMVFMPPRHGKSELVSRVLPAFIHGKLPDAEIMAASYNDSLAGEMCISVQKFMDSEPYKEVFPGVEIPPPRGIYTQGIRNSEEHCIVGRRGKYRGQGVGGSFTGKGANFIIVDDPIKGREVADSVAFREKLWNFWVNDLFSRLETDIRNGRLGQVLITLTRWHEDDLAGRLLKRMKESPEAIQWDVVSFPAIRVDMDNPDDPRKIGEALWPLKYNEETLKQIKEADNSPRAWGSLYQQNPVPVGGNYFTDKMFSIEEVPTEYDYTFVTADTAYKEKQKSDFTVFSLWGVKRGQLYLIAIYRKQIEASKVEDEIEPILKGWQGYGFRGSYIEPKGHGIYLNQKFRQKSLPMPRQDLLDEFYKDRRFDKVERANNVTPHLATRKVILNKNIPLVEELVTESLAFPNGAHDDFVDTLVDALKITYGSKTTVFDNL